MSSRFVSVSLFCLQVLLAMRANVEDRGMKGDCTPLMEVMILIRFTFLFSNPIGNLDIFLVHFQVQFLLNSGTSNHICARLSRSCLLLSSRLHGSCNLKYAHSTPLQNPICLLPPKNSTSRSNKDETNMNRSSCRFLPGGLCRTHGYRPPSDCPWR